MVRSVDFERVLRCPPRARTAHFALHHLQGRPTPAAKPAPRSGSGELSTGEVPVAVVPVDDSLAKGSDDGSAHWLGLVIPKRHARRSVTRSLLKRQIRVAASSHEPSLPGGLWVVRLRAGFDRQAFPSAASTALSAAARAELVTLFQRASR
ncbi:ribonuclease P protein component [Piscinibacter aquaticus]|uniref:Ribonuclease P protein component n=1 Tax=Piscinibacter aquaticus TaxID=392597 RepID=A0A5C6U4P9_9BURK|nr:ribonuclease P protein component [Piscinibacter aquaticus]